MMNKRNVIRCILAVLMMVYVVGALIYTSARANERRVEGVAVDIAPADGNEFVTPAHITGAIHAMSLSPDGQPASALNLHDMEARLRGLDNIESVNCLLSTDCSLRVHVRPIVPVARIFDQNGMQYFINREGKRVNALAGYRVDVPVVIGHFSQRMQPTIILPYIDYLQAHPELDALVSAIKVNGPRDIIIVPGVRGHVVNMGDTCDIDNKFQRLRAFYAQVMPVKGWQYYDTLSVKWRGRVIASRADKRRRLEQQIHEEHDDLDDASTMGTAVPDSAAIHHPNP